MAQKPATITHCCRPPYRAKNGPLDTFEELLLVRGVTPWHLYGEDANRNGLLDPNEDDGDAYPPDNADGQLDRGWSVYLSIHGRERNVQADGTPRIDVNDRKLAELYNALAAELDEDVARFVVAYRLYGPAQPNVSLASIPAEKSLTGTPNEFHHDDDQRVIEAKEMVGEPAAASADTMSDADVDEEDFVRGGMDLGHGGSFEIGSVYDLVGVEVQGQMDGIQTTIESHWSDDISQMADYLPEILDTLSITSEPSLEGRININLARLETLIGIPGMTETLAGQIVAATRSSDGQPVLDARGERTTTAWLIIDRIADLETMRKLDPHITAGGDVFRAQVVGYFDAGGPTTRLETVIDATQCPPRIVRFRDLTELGRGYPRHLIVGED